jgi:hypothetical protein
MENSRVVCLCCSYGSNSVLGNMDEFGYLSVASGRSQGGNSVAEDVLAH